MRTFTIKERILNRLNLLPLPIYDAFAAPLFGHILGASVRLNLFDVLAVPCSVAAIAKAANIHPDSASLMLASLAKAGYLKKSGDCYAASPAGTKWLMKSSPHYLGNLIRYVELLYAHWQYLEETLKEGEPPVTYIESFGQREWEIYVNGMMDLAKLFMPHVLPKLQMPDRAGRLLDLGGSHGLYSMELCRRYPRLRSTIVDFPQVLKFTGKILAGHGMADRIELEAANVLERRFGENEFDAVLAFNIVHGLTPVQLAAFLVNIEKTLKPGGCLYVLDQLLVQRGSDTEQFVPLMVGINLMNEVGGRAYSVKELEELSSTAGLSKIRVWRLRLPGLALVRMEKRLLHT